MVASIFIVIITVILAPIASMIINALALPVVTAMVNAWTSLYRRLAPENEAKAHRSDVRSDVDDMISASEARGYKPSQMAVHITLLMIPKLKSDVVWLAGYLPPTLADRLVKTSGALSNVRTPTRLISSLAGLGLMNWFLYMSDDHLTWMQWILVNCGLVAMVLVMWNQQQPWARRVLHLYLGLATAIMIVTIIWVPIKYRLYEVPLFYQHTLAMLPGFLAIAVASNEFRGRVSKGHWWPVFACWGLVVAIAVGVAALTESLRTLLTVWAVMVVILLSLAILCGLAAVGALVLWYCGSRASAGAMRLLATGLLRSQRRRTKDTS